ncbi:S9 family peptidase [Lysobacter sp. 5GHs7-4]|uniref:S9 family peptidase n=1 Tax=Lysobacter sp. 5GHs7-4 TaxID=2904253 RepID=UPI001E326020|nr:S9 family peptidase [Lysobacter sp. 5GHs7-4]UHQ23158.1 S9 family peptidase [Lysobacter sp. 5GHs7-4]
MRHATQFLFCTLVCCSLAPDTRAQGAAPTPITLTQAMADPDWIGPPVEQAWWAWDGHRVQYRLKRAGATVRDTWQLDERAQAPAARVDGAALADLDAAAPVYDAARQRMAFVRNGDVFVRDLRSGALTQLTRSLDAEARPRWSRDGQLAFSRGHDWYRWSAAQGVVQVASLKAELDPAAAPKPDDLRERQLATLRTLRDDRAQREHQREQDEAWRRDDPSRAPPPTYLGDGVEIVDSALSPDARWLLAVTEPKDADRGRRGQMPLYVTESGYEEFEQARTRVGRNAPPPQTLWLIETANGRVREIAYAPLPGIAEDPLAAMRKAAGLAPLKGERAVRIGTGGVRPESGIRWSEDGRHAAVLVRAVDNKDRWIASIAPERASLQPRHRLTDPAWINWNFNDFGWTADGALWFLSEHSGYSHLYLSEGDGQPRALTSGRWEASAPSLSADGRRFYFVCNRAWPGDYEVCAVDRDGGTVREITALDGVEDFALSPDGGRLVVRHSSSHTPPQLSTLTTDGSGLRALTDTRTPEFKQRQWARPEYVRIPSRHGAEPIWGKYYGPHDPQPGRKYPVVVFVHGAGYLQNVSARYPNYFREQMFHHLLVQQGYIVLDLDYRASEGYGRDWRTAIYRQMGHPEVEDYLDGLDWLVTHKQGDRDRAGIYGGSYGGFVTFMTLFRKPGVFKAGAALRPPTDLQQYNHEYTSNVLNTPELDPQAYAKSSPIGYAEGLQDHLLIAHGVIDDNVFYRDPIMLAQRLIELRKDKWELASYPLERHSFVRSDSWYDQYRRIYELFERTVK